MAKSIALEDAMRTATHVSNEVDLKTAVQQGKLVIISSNSQLYAKMLKKFPAEKVSKKVSGAGKAVAGAGALLAITTGGLLGIPLIAGGLIGHAVGNVADNYRDTPDPVEGTPPVCMSQNSITSHDGKACARCPYNDFGSKDGASNAKACKESVLLFLLRPNSIIPLLIRVPVTSKPRFLKYSTRLLSPLTPISSVVTKITLEKATSKQGKPYALFNFEVVSTLTSEEADHAKAYARQFMEIVNAAELVPELAEAS